MKTKLLLTSFVILMMGQGLIHAQEPAKKGSMEGNLYVVRDTLEDGSVSAFFYNSEKDYLKSKKQREQEIEKLREKKKVYEAEQRNQLAEDIKRINDRVDQYESYTKEMAGDDKMKTAEMYAERIQKHNAMIDSQIEFYQVAKKVDPVENSTFGIVQNSNGGMEFKIGENWRDRRKEVGTHSFLAMGFGYNFINGDQLDINDFSYSNNNYFSIGILWQTPLTENQKLRVNYGVQYQTHGTELNGGRIFSPNTDDTQIIDLGFQPEKAKFRQDQFVFPVQLEFGGTDKKEYEDGRVRYEQWDKWKFGIGGFAGFNTSSRLKRKYEENGREIKTTIANAFENETFIYGIDAYVGHDQVVAFARMNLNDIFKDGSVDGQYIAFGLRLQ